MSHRRGVVRQEGMSGTRNPEVVVVGAGLAGLTAAAVVARAGHRVVVLEARARAGGRARTDLVHGIPVNQGAHALYRGGPGWAVLRELGVIPVGEVPLSGGRLVVGDELRRLPTGPLTLMGTGALGPREKAELAGLLARLPSVDTAALGGTSVSQWIADSVSGERSAALLRALVRLSTYCDDPGKLSAEVAVGQLQLSAGGGVLYLYGGWSQLTEALAGVAGVRVRPGVAVSELPEAPAVVLAPGGPRLVERLLGCDLGLGPAANVACLDLVVDRPPSPPFLLGLDRPHYLSDHSATLGSEREGPAGEGRGRHLVSVMQYHGVGERTTGPRWRASRP